MKDATSILLSVLMMGLSYYFLARLFRQGRLLTPVGGLHLMVFVFMGLGPLAFNMVEPEGERLSVYQLKDTITRVSYAFVGGYLLATWLEVRWERRRNARVKPKRMGKLSLANTTALFLVCLSAIGYVLGRLELSSMGIGTLFVVFRMFLYPTIVMLVASLRRDDWTGWFFVSTTLALGVVFSFLSVWRSELVVFAASVGLGISLRKGVALWKYALVGLIFAIIVLPFLQWKKSHYEQVRSHLWLSVVTSQQISLGERLELMGRFCAARLNYVREMVYVQNAIEEGRTMPRKGETYVQAAQQLVPRLVWPNKPSFNQTAGFMLPREIGLLATDDMTTSWAVNCFGEFIWNFDYRFLVLVVPLVVYLCLRIEWFINRVYHHEDWRSFTQIVMFFQILNLVSVISSITFFVWCSLVTLSMDRLKERRSNKARRAPASAPNSPALENNGQDVPQPEEPSPERRRPLRRYSRARRGVRGRSLRPDGARASAQ